MTGFKYYADKVLGEIKSSFANNMFILLFLILVFIIPLIAAYYYPDSFASVLQPMIQQFEQNIADGTVTLATDSLFVNNFTVALILYAGGALLGIMGITVLAMNGLFLGFFAAQMDLTSYIALTLPHGIFEIPAIIIACAGGLVLLKFAVLFVWNIIRPDRQVHAVFKQASGQNQGILHPVDGFSSLADNCCIHRSQSDYSDSQILLRAFGNPDMIFISH